MGLVIYVPFCYKPTSPPPYLRRKFRYGTSFGKNLYVSARLLLTPKSLATFGDPAKSTGFVGKRRSKGVVRFCAFAQNL